MVRLEVMKVERRQPSKEVVSEKLKKLRGNRSIFAVSEGTGIGVSALLNYEAGLRIPNDEAKVAIANYYNVTTDELFYSG